MPRRVFVDCDYSASPLWNADDPSTCFDPRMFDLSEDLVERLENWARDWDRRAWELLDAEFDEEADDDLGERG